MPRANSRQAANKLAKEIISLNKIWPLIPPPVKIFTPQIIHDLDDFYKKIYFIGKKLSKTDRYGLWLEIQKEGLISLKISIQAAFSPKKEKTKILSTLPLEIEILKYLVRLAGEIHIINDEKYLALEQKLQNISKGANGWLAYSRTEDDKIAKELE